MQTDLSQAEADALLRMEKFRVDNTSHAFPDLGGSIQIALTTKYQTRGRQSLVLARLDFNSPHRNPDDTEVGIPHLHLYREGYADKWAYDLPADLLKNSADAWQTLHDFMAYCSIVEPPDITKGLFS
jgi:hypothetical protein